MDKILLSLENVLNAKLKAIFLFTIDVACSADVFDSSWAPFCVMITFLRETKSNIAH